MQNRSASIDSTIDSTVPVTMEKDFGLEIAELEMILDMKAEEGIAFFDALPCALASSGNEWLFDFPAERFPLPAQNVAAVRLNSGDDSKICYVIEPLDDAGYRLVEDDEIDGAYLDFANAWLDVAQALRPMLGNGSGGALQ